MKRSSFSWKIQQYHEILRAIKEVLAHQISSIPLYPTVIHVRTPKPLVKMIALLVSSLPGLVRYKPAKQRFILQYTALSIDDSDSFIQGTAVYTMYSSYPSPHLSTLAQNYIRRLLADHVCRDSRECARDPRKHRRIHNSQTRHASDPETGVKYSLGVVISTNRTGRRSMVTPRVILDIIGNLVLRVDLGTGEDLIDGNKLALEAIAGDLDSLRNSSNVLLVVSYTAIEVVVLDIWDLEWIG